MKIINQGYSENNGKLEHKKTSTCDCCARKGSHLCLHLRWGGLSRAKHHQLCGEQWRAEPDQQFTNPGHSTPLTGSGCLTTYPKLNVQHTKPASEIRAIEIPNILTVGLIEFNRRKIGCWRNLPIHKYLQQM